MNDVDEILDFDDNVDFSFTEDPQVTDSNLLESDSLFDLDAEMSFATGGQRAEGKLSPEEENKEMSELIDNQLSGNSELDNNSTLVHQKDQEELKYGEIEDFDMDDPDFLKEYGEINGDEVVIEDDEFWKELGLDPPNVVAEVENERTAEKSGTTEKFDTDNANISKTTPKENTPKRSLTSQLDAVKVNSAKLDISSSKSVKRTSKSPGISTSPEKEDGRGSRRNNDWRPVNNSGSFLNNNMSSFRSGFGPGLEGMPGIPMGQMPLNNPSMLPNLNMPPGPMIGPNIHVNPNFARLRPHALPFGNPINQYPMGSGPPMNMMPYQGQMEMHPYHPSMAPMGGGRGNSNSYGVRGVSPGFSHHNSISPPRRLPVSQQNNQRPIPSPKRKVPNDGFDQKEPDSKKISVTNGKSSAPDAKPTSSSQKNAEKSKVTVTTVTTKDTSGPAVKASNSKQGTATAITSKAASVATKNKVAPTSDNRSGSTSTKQPPKPVQKPAPKNIIRSLPSKPSVASSETSKSTAAPSTAASSVGVNKLTIGNVVEGVTKRDIQDLANKIPGGILSITFDRSAQTAEVSFKTSEGAKLFRRKYNR
ncbi:19369_t:CDS:2 [Funneliformis geosporum]|uniref:15314_t:CDS:1 n=1 Tax=Funneliformis geosporum TaxID=1117311 RepID=A0A9W4SDQ8_9GLOM|nr:19369_t:CDS:2 [Funneliformis geosporum]CAI2164747.1 15314_t:CDS:2 [Funneliformis geosporum]